MERNARHNVMRTGIVMQTGIEPAKRVTSSRSIDSVPRSLRRSHLSIETTSRRIASPRRSDLLPTLHHRAEQGTGNSYGVRTVERAGIYRQVTPTEFGL